MICVWLCGWAGGWTGGRAGGGTCGRGFCRPASQPACQPARCSVQDLFLKLLLLIAPCLAGLLPAEALAPFADELAQRERKRAQRAKQEARRIRQERAADAAAAAAAANSGLSAAELRAMPLPSASLAPAGVDREAVEDAREAAAARGVRRARLMQASKPASRPGRRPSQVSASQPWHGTALLPQGPCWPARQPRTLFRAAARRWGCLLPLWLPRAFGGRGLRRLLHPHGVLVSPADHLRRTRQRSSWRACRSAAAAAKGARARRFPCLEPRSANISKCHSPIVGSPFWRSHLRSSPCDCLCGCFLDLLLFFPLSALPQLLFCWLVVLQRCQKNSLAGP